MTNNCPQLSLSLSNASRFILLHVVQYLLFGRWSVCSHDISYREFLFHSVDFLSRISRIFDWMARFSEIHQFLDFLKTFPGNFCTNCPLFGIFLNETRSLFSIARFSTSLLIRRDKHGLSLYFGLLARSLVINNIYTHAAAEMPAFLQHFFYHKFLKQKIKPPFLFSQALNRNKTTVFFFSAREK